MASKKCEGEGCGVEIPSMSRPVIVGEKLTLGGYSRSTKRTLCAVCIMAKYLHQYALVGRWSGRNN